MKIERLITLESVDSTNSYIKNIPDCPVCVRALSQSAGRGRLGRSFLSPYGGLYFSVRIRDLPGRELIPAAAAVAVARCIPGSSIKWPNDILLGGKKVCGILCQSSSADLDIIIGIGINVSSAPLECACCTGGDADELFSAVLRQLENTVSMLEEGNTSALLACYRAVLATRNVPVRVAVEGSEICGMALGVDDCGALLVRTDNGLYHVSSGEATLIKNTSETEGK